MRDSFITTEIEIPGSLHTAIQNYLNQHPYWNINSFFITEVISIYPSTLLCLET